MSFEEQKSVFRYPRLLKATAAAAGVVIGILAARIVVVPFTVSDDSMNPALSRGQVVYALKHVTPRFGEVVLIESPVEPGRVLVKRVVGCGGDFIEVRNKAVYRNGEKGAFNWKIVSADNRVFPMDFSQRDDMPAVKLEADEYFLLGDNLDYSFDSRTFGPVSRERIIGRIIFGLERRK
jgi:signal peptidase I